MPLVEHIAVRQLADRSPGGEDGVPRTGAVPDLAVPDPDRLGHVRRGVRTTGAERACADLDTNGIYGRADRHVADCVADHMREREVLLARTCSEARIALLAVDHEPREPPKRGREPQEQMVNRLGPANRHTRPAFRPLAAEYSAEPIRFLQLAVIHQQADPVTTE